MLVLAGLASRASRGQARRSRSRPCRVARPGGEPLPARPGVLCASCNARKGLNQRRR